jgi:stage II sporulation protein D
LKVFGLVVAIAIFSISAEGATIRVRLQKAAVATEITGLGLSIGTAPASYKTVALPQVRKARIKLLDNNGRFPVWSIKFDGETQQKRLVGHRLFVEGDVVRLGLHPAPHALELVALPNGKADVIASLDIEKYLTGVLPSEMPANWPAEALKAQAIASRSYAIALAKERQSLNYDVENTVLDQVFDMRNKVGASDAIQEKIAEVVRVTRGIVLLDQRGRVVKAHYHADCGGHTELAKNVWGDDVKETGITKDAMCPLSPYANWRLEMPRQEIQKIMAAYFMLDPRRALLALAPLGRTVSGRVAQVDMVFDDGIHRRLPAHEFRRLLGYSKLKSTNFRLAWANDAVVVEGKGHGHGVGLCQYGTRQLAVRGMSYQDIIKNYYPLAKLGRVQDGGIGRGSSQVL